MRLPRPHLAVFLAGSTVFLAFAPFAWWWVAPLSLAVLFHLQSQADTGRAAASLGWAYGLGYFLATIHWIYIALHRFGGMPSVLAASSVLLLAAFLALYPALAAAAAWRLSRGCRPALLWLALPGCWALSEWVRSWLFTGFPWASIGYSQIPEGPLAAYAPLLGIYGVGWLLAISSAALCQLALFWRTRMLKPRLLGGMLCMLALWGLGPWLSHTRWTHPDGPPLQVSLLQGGIAQDQKWDEATLLATLSAYQALVAQAEGDLVVLPETALPLFLHEIPPDYLDKLRTLLQRKSASLIMGVPRVDDNGRDYHNAAIVLDHPPPNSYQKSHLVPFGEFIPFKVLLGWVYTNVLHMPLADFSAGPASQPPLRIKGQTIAVNICYEDIFGEELLPGARQAGLLLNLSNLAWFDGSIALAQHGQIAQARALETGRTVLRATNSGTTAIIAPNGQYLARLPEGRPGVLTGTAQGYAGETPYMRWGNGAFLLLSGLALTLAWQAGRRVTR